MNVLLRRHRILAVCCALGCAAAVVHADSRHDAKRHFQKGMSLIHDGQTDAGVQELEEAYAIKPHPNVLYNMALAYDLAHRRREALAAYERYLSLGPPDPGVSQERVAQLRKELEPPPAPVAPTTTPATVLPASTPAPARGNSNVDALLKAAAAWEARAAQLESQPALAPNPAPSSLTPVEPGASSHAGAAVTPEVLPWWQAWLRTGDLEETQKAPEDVYERTVVTASRTGRSAVLAPASVSVITDEDIHSSGARTIPDLLRRVAGMDVMAMSATDQNVSIRGFNQRLSNRVLVLVDGRSVYQDYLGTTFWNALTVNLDDIERIEVIRGPGAALYGANAVVGIVNIITKKARPGTHAAARVTLGYPLTLDAAVRGESAQGPLSLAASAGYVRNRKWALELDRSRVDVVPAFQNIPFDLSGEVVRGDATAAWTPARFIQVSAHAGVSKVSEEIFAIGALRNFLMDGYLVTASAEAETGPLKLRTFYNGARLRVGPQLMTAGSADPILRLAADTLDAEGTYTAHFSFLGEHRVVVGASYRLKTVNWGLLAGPQLEHHGGALGEDTWTGPGGHRLVVSARLDRHPLVGMVPSARGAFVLRTGQSAAVRAVIGTAFRNPTFLESYLNVTPGAAVPGVSIRSFGNTSLRPEQNVMAEVGYSAELGDAITLDLATYYGRLRGLIMQGPLLPPQGSKTYDTLTSTFIAGESRFINDDQTFSQVGGEASILVNPVEGLDLYANYAFLRVLQEEKGTWLESTPAHKVNAGARVSTPLGFMVSADGHAVSSAVWAERTFDPSAPNGVRVDSLHVPPYVLLECKAAWRAPGDRLDLFVQSDNALGWIPLGGTAGLGGTALQPAAGYLGPLMAHREHPLGNPSPARVMAGVAAQL